MWPTVSTVLAILILAGSDCWAQETVEAPALFMSSVDWQKPPQDLQKTYWEGSAGIVALYASGEFAFVSAGVFRDIDSGDVTVCRGCGYSIRRGTWKQNGDDAIEVRSEWTYRNLPPSDHRLFADPTTLTWAATIDPETKEILFLNDGTSRYDRLPELANSEALREFLRGSPDEERLPHLQKPPSPT